MPRAKKTEIVQAACMTCAYFIREQATKTMQPEYGDCRRYPPTVVVDEEGMSSVWPLVEMTDGCGEWRARMNA